MSTDFSPKPFPIPVVSELGIGSHSEDETLDYLHMPSGMATYHAPVLPEPEELVGQEGAVRVLYAALNMLNEAVAGRPTEPISLAGLSPRDLALVHQVLGEGEVSAQVQAVAERPGVGAQIQESVFAGVWRVLEQTADGQLLDQIEVGAVPAVLGRAAREDARVAPAALPLTPEFGNAQAVLTELVEHRQNWRPGKSAEVVNLTLLPLSPLDIGVIDTQIGTGRVLILSRGYGNCRITNACVPNTWRVVYYNSQDAVILNSVEVCAMPEVACAAHEDLVDSAERLVEVLAWLDGDGATS